MVMWFRHAQKALAYSHTYIRGTAICHLPQKLTLSSLVATFYNDFIINHTALKH